MNIKKNCNITSIILLVFIIAFTGYTFLNNRPTKPEISIKSFQLLNDYIFDEEKANESYNNKMIKVTGIVKNITYLNERNTIFLDGNHKSSNIICDLNNSQKKKLEYIKRGQKIVVTGICKGFLKDIIILNCYIETK
jgi:hypothetical protein